MDLHSLLDYSSCKKAFDEIPDDNHLEKTNLANHAFTLVKADREAKYRTATSITELMAIFSKDDEILRWSTLCHDLLIEIRFDIKPVQPLCRTPLTDNITRDVRVQDKDKSNVERRIEPRAYGVEALNYLDCTRTLVDKITSSVDGVIDGFTTASVVEELKEMPEYNVALASFVKSHVTYNERYKGENIDNNHSSDPSTKFAWNGISKIVDSSLTVANKVGGFYVVHDLASGNCKLPIMLDRFYGKRKDVPKFQFYCVDLMHNSPKDGLETPESICKRRGWRLARVTQSISHYIKTIGKADRSIIVMCHAAGYMAKHEIAEVNKLGNIIVGFNYDVKFIRDSTRISVDANITAANGRLMGNIGKWALNERAIDVEQEFGNCRVVPVSTLCGIGFSGKHYKKTSGSLETFAKAFWSLPLRGVYSYIGRQLAKHAVPSKIRVKPNNYRGIRDVESFNFEQLSMGKVRVCPKYDGDLLRAACQLNNHRYNMSLYDRSGNHLHTFSVDQDHMRIITQDGQRYLPDINFTVMLECNRKTGGVIATDVIPGCSKYLDIIAADCYGRAVTTLLSARTKFFCAAESDFPVDGIILKDRQLLSTYVGGALRLKTVPASTMQYDKKYNLFRFGTCARSIKHLDSKNNVSTSSTVPPASMPGLVHDALYEVFVNPTTLKAHVVSTSDRPRPDSRFVDNTLLSTAICSAILLKAKQNGNQRVVVANVVRALTARNKFLCSALKGFHNGKPRIACLEASTVLLVAACSAGGLVLDKTMETFFPHIMSLYPTVIRKLADKDIIRMNPEKNGYSLNEKFMDGQFVTPMEALVLPFPVQELLK